jgi:hypothetical protein
MAGNSRGALAVHGDDRYLSLIANHHRTDQMRPFRLTMFAIGVALSAFVAPFGGQRARADPVEPVQLETGDAAPICSSEGIVVGPQSSAMSEGPCPAPVIEAHRTARARAYLIETATPGYTMMLQGPERAIGRLHPEFVRRLAAAIVEARGAGLPFAGIFSAYRPPAFGVGGFADKFHSLHTYGLAVDIAGIGAPGTPTALLWHEIAARHGLICPYGPHNPVEWNHCQPTWVRIILAENPLRETVTADGPISLEGMFQAGYSLISASRTVDGSTPDPPAQFLKPPQTRAAVPVDPRTTSAANMKTTHNQTIPKAVLPVFDRYAIRWPPISGGKVGWPKGVPRIARLDEEPRRPNSPSASRASSVRPILIIADHSVSRSAIRSAYKNTERLRQARSNTTAPNSAQLAKNCRALAIKAHPTQRAGSGTGSAQAQRDYFQECVAKRPQKLTQPS